MSCSAEDATEGTDYWAAKKAQKDETRSAWNKGIEVGQRAPFTAQEVKRIKSTLAKRGDDGLRDLALFSTAIDSMLHAVDLLSLTVKDVRKRDRTIRDTVKAAMAGTTSSVECMLSDQTRSVLENWLAQTAKKQNEPVFTGRNHTGNPPALAEDRGPLHGDCKPHPGGICFLLPTRRVVQSHCIQVAGSGTVRGGA